MSIKVQTTVGFADIFRFAEKEHGVDWNRANDMFFSSEMLRYKGYNTIEIDEIKYSLESEDFYGAEDEKEEYFLGLKVLVNFMETHKLEKMLVLND